MCFALMFAWHNQACFAAELSDSGQSQIHMIAMGGSINQMPCKVEGTTSKKASHCDQILCAGILLPLDVVLHKPSAFKLVFEGMTYHPVAITIKPPTPPI